MSRFDSARMSVRHDDNNKKEKTSSAIDPSNTTSKPWRGVDGDDHLNQHDKNACLPAQSAPHHFHVDQTQAHAGDQSRNAVPFTRLRCPSPHMSQAWCRVPAAGAAPRIALAPHCRVRSHLCPSFVSARGIVREERKGISLPAPLERAFTGWHSPPSAVRSTRAQYSPSFMSQQPPIIETHVTMRRPTRGCRAGALPRGPRSGRPASSKSHPGRTRCRAAGLRRTPPAGAGV